MGPLISVDLTRYPESDGKPMGETDLHRTEMFRHINILQLHFAGQKVYVTGDLLLYYEKGNTKKFIVPDTFVVKGIDQYPRRIYKTWYEGRVPNVVFETTSRKTRKKDTDVKPALYASLGIKEFFLFDLEGDYLDPKLQAYRLVDDKYELMVPDASGRLASEELDLWLIAENDHLQFYDRKTGQRLLTSDERTEQEALRADTKAAELAAAEAEIAQLRETIAKLKNS